LTAGLADAIAGQGGISLLGGGPGIGKTRLAEKLAVGTEEQGARVLWGRCIETDGASAFWPWVEMIRSWMQSMGSDVGLAAIGPLSADVTQLIPELHALPS
jgi:eukaryotic-like serine/threonine-protein kinase